VLSPVRSGARADAADAALSPRAHPAEPALGGVEPLIQKLRLKVRRVDDDILASVRQQSTSGSQAKADLEAAMHAIQARWRAAEHACRRVSQRSAAHTRTG
jgi:hypothetical protein